MKNEPAFPFFNDNNLYSGITKREYFAAMAMQGLMSSDVILNGLAAKFDSDTVALKTVSSISYKVADAMLEDGNK